MSFPNSNPYSSSLSIYNSKFYPPFPPSFFLQLKILIGIFGIGILIPLIGLGIRVYRSFTDTSNSKKEGGGGRGFWIVRIEKGGEGGGVGNWRIQQNTAVLFLGFKGLFCIVVVISLIKQIQIYEHHNSSNDILIWRTAIWLPLLAGGIIETIGILAASPLFVSSSKSHSRHFPHLLLPCLSLLFLIISIISILIPLILANQNFNKLISLYFKFIKPILEQANSTWTGKLDSAYLSILAQLAGESIGYLDGCEKWVRVGFGLMVGWIWFTYFLFMLGVVSVYRVLKFQKEVLNRTASTLRLLLISQLVVVVVPEIPESSENEMIPYIHLNKVDYKSNGIDSKLLEAITMESKASELELSRKHLLFQTLVFTVCVFGYTAVCIAVALDPISAFQNPTYYALTQLSGYWIYAIIGIPSMVLVTLSGINSSSGNFLGTPLTTSSSSSSSSGGNATSTRNVHVKKLSCIKEDEEEEEGYEDEEVSFEMKELCDKGKLKTFRESIRNSFVSTSSSNSDEIIRSSRMKKSNSDDTMIPELEEEEEEKVKVLVDHQLNGGWKPSDWSKVRDEEKEIA